MIVYYILFFITVVFSKAVEKSGKPVKLPYNEEEENRASFIAAVFSYLPTIIILGLRDNVGDTSSYVMSFEGLAPQGIFYDLSERNPGYTVLQNFAKLYITEDGNYFVLIVTIISVLLMLKAHSRYSPMFMLSTFIFFGSTEVSYVFNGARQFLAISIMLYSMRFVEEKKLIKYAICSLVAFSIHQTAVVVIPAYFIASGKFLNIKIIITGLATVVATAFSSLFIEYVNDLFISDSVYSQYYDKLINTAGINIFRVLVAAVPVILCLIYKKRIDELNDPMLNYCANMSVLALAISAFSATSGGELLGRLAEYYLIFNTLTYPMLFKRIVSKNARTALQAALMIGYFFFFFYQITVVWEQGYESSKLGISIGMEEI